MVITGICEWCKCATSSNSLKIRDPSTCSILRILLFILIFLAKEGRSQDLRDFPPLFNAAKDKPLVTFPAQSSCGVPQKNAYCKSATFVESVQSCFEVGRCDNECPIRSTSPAYSAFLVAARNYDACVTKDQINISPNAGSTEFSALFSSVGALCHLLTSTSPSLGANGAFTLTFWVWQKEGNDGIVMEKYFESNGDKTAVISVRLSTSGITLTYHTVFGQRIVQLLGVGSIPSETWIHIAIQVYDVTVSYFLDGLGVGFDSTDTRGLVGQISDQEGVFLIGQNAKGEGQFLGRLQDVRFYSEALTNRQIQDVYTGAGLPDVLIQTECLCPPTYPRTKPSKTHLCIRNGVQDNLGDETLRLNVDAHPLHYMNDGDSNSRWISTLLDDVTIEVDLNDQFQVFYVVLQFYSPQPKLVTIERKESSTSSWTLWQQYAEDCEVAFGVPNNGPLPNPTSVNCIQFGSGGSIVPYSKGNITFNLLSPEPVPRPGHNDFYSTPELFEFVKASAIRVRLRDHYYVTQFRHKYFGIFEYIVTGRCNCHGHADKCDETSAPYMCTCDADSHTEGDRCQACQPLYNDKPFRQGDQLNSYACKECQCYGHAVSCVYNSTLDLFPADHDRGGGGECEECQHHTTGQRCDQCLPYYFRPSGKSLYDEDVCQICDCHEPGLQSDDIDCQQVGGQCTCKLRTSSRRCDKCAPGYYNLQASNPEGCESCRCEEAGTIGGDISCHASLGQCTCKSNVRGLACDSCQFGFYNLEASNPDGCGECACDPSGSLDTYCNPASGQCSCKPNIIGRQCDECVAGYYNFAEGCLNCACDAFGTVEGGICDERSGLCQCKPYVQGQHCDECRDGYFDLGSDSTMGCQSCQCDPAGTEEQSTICDKETGECTCKINVQERKCNQCKPNTFNLTATNQDGCHVCDCDPTGTASGDTLPFIQLACDQTTGQCSCLANRIGRTCDQCLDGFFLNKESGGGCDACVCQSEGTIAGSLCDAVTGQCHCLGGDSGVGGPRCDSCVDGYYKFSVFDTFCDSCECDPTGSVNNTCEPIGGQCPCKLFTTRRQCGYCVEGTSGIDANNPFGCSKTPSQQPPPDHEPINSTALRLYWLPPDSPNGVILKYILYQDGNSIAEFQANVTEYMVTGLEPFTEYQFFIETFNDFGSTTSPVKTIRTPVGIPMGEMVLTVSDITSRTAKFAWNVPATPNGKIQKYQLTSTTLSDSVPRTWYQGLALTATVAGLNPYTYYKFYVSVCTDGGCLVSRVVTLTTKQDVPTGQAPPVMLALTTSSFYITWQPPSEPNGIIIFYELWMRGVLKQDGTRDPEEQRIFLTAGWYNAMPTASPQENALPPPETNFTIDGLEAYTEYEFQVFCENSRGKAASVWVATRTQEAVPVFMSAPIATAISSTAVNLTWSPPTDEELLGQVVMYKVYWNRPNNLEINPFAPEFTWTFVYRASPDELTYVVDGLSPYSLNTFRLEACNSKGCVNSSDVHDTTFAAAPSGIIPPLVDGYNDTTMAIEWQPPKNPNSPDLEYVVRRMAPSFNNPPPHVTRGTRFIGDVYYQFPPETIPQGVTFTGIDLKFRTKRRDGLLVFAASAGGQEEYVAVQLRAGRPWFFFDAQGCLVIVTTTDDEGLPYADYRWHHLVAKRDGKNGYITLDGTWTGTNLRLGDEGEQEGDCSTGNIIGENTGVYIGGLPDDYILQRSETEQRATVQEMDFIGCITDVRIMVESSPEEIWQDLDWSTQIKHEDAMPTWEGCPQDIELDTYHFLGAGYMVMKEGALEDEMLELTFGMRTEVQNGLLFFSYGAENVYLLIQIVAGGIHLEYNNNKGPKVVLYPGDGQLCNGLWHEFEVFRGNGLFYIDVDGDIKSVPDEDGLEPLFFTSNFYIGGIPDDSDGKAFVDNNQLAGRVQGSFSGCFKRIYPYRHADDLTANIVNLKNVNLDGCPQEVNSADPCLVSQQNVIYRGNETTIHDYGLNSFTEYMYQVEVVNPEGTDTSQYNVGRTREGPPQGVSGPENVQVVDGYTITASWQHPTWNTGQLTEYILRAYITGNPSQPPAQTVYNDTTRTSGVISTATPNTNYTVVFVACTMAGCTESDAKVDVNTPVEPPREVQPPFIIEQGGYHLYIGWTEPLSPNGPLTGYYLFMGNIELYAGGVTKYNVTELSVYTAYDFYVRACTPVGCTDSEIALLTTSQLPPEAVNAPVLLVLGTTRIKVTWDHPNQVNGVLERYLLYVSEDPDEEAQVWYNNTDLFLDHTLTDLTPGTTYYVSVQACTGGGCTISGVTSDTTEESAPEGLPDPVITSPSPTELGISWGLPELPNGVITLYRLYHNGLLIYTDQSIREHTIRHLQPWSLHLIRVDACTDKGCSSSNEVEGRTQEALPLGTIGLDLSVVDGRTVDVKWNALQNPNGRIYYDVYFEGFFYTDPDNWDYRIESDRRSLYTTESAGDWVSVKPLVPYSEYFVQVNCSNSRGFILSNIKTAVMPKDTPDGVRPPLLTSPTSTSIRAVWQTVGRSNADQDPAFQLQFRSASPGSQVEDLFPQPSTSTTFLKSGLQPFTEYQFRLIAINVYGETTTDWVSLVTKQDKPSGVAAPLVGDIDSRTANVWWERPTQPNGILTQYNLYQNNVARDEYPSNITEIELVDLVPFTTYVFNIEACTVAGCTRSPDSRPATTLRAPPEEVPAPSLLSETPTSVLVVWQEPGLPNGQILQYSVERRLAGEEEVTVLQTFLPSEARMFVDKSEELTPHTTYQYRVGAFTVAGEGYSPWAEVTTLSSRPGGVEAPQVDVLGPTSAEVSWDSPRNANGRLVSYLIRFPSPRYEIRNTSQLSILVENLTPYTTYYVTVTACSDGGCTESSAVQVTTASALPVGMEPPVPTPHSQSYISVLWTGPLYPNGFSIRYELARTKLRQPLQDGAGGFDVWTSLYSGTDTFYEDRGLTIYTTYQYRVTVYNDHGHITSQPSEEVSTFGGIPTKPAVASISTINHTAVDISWVTPIVKELQGGVVTYIVNVTGGGEKGEEEEESLSREYGQNVSSVILNEFQPNTRYGVTVTMLMHGGASITSAMVYTTTQDGAPSGLAPPYTTVISETSLRVAWTAPEEPNGQIVGYNIYLDQLKIPTGMNTPGSYVLNDLEPYTIYMIKVEVCTVFACLKSAASKATTAESVPEGMASPVVQIQSAHAVYVAWSAPRDPSGILLRYELWRKDTVLCSELVHPTDSTPVGKCTYLECTIQESFCGSQCFSGPKVCCDGILHNVVRGYECCGSHYIPQRLNPSDICCGNNFHTKLENHQCCGERYIQVLPEEICCVDADEDRVDIGIGDRCCASVPYSDSGSQICCDGELHNRYRQQCCGGEMTDDSFVCCGNDTAGRIHEPDTGKMCCGNEYINQKTSVCCTDTTSVTKVHHYASEMVKLSANQKCCNLERISYRLSCCNGVGYNPITQVCADTSSQQTGCGTGTICEDAKKDSAFCNRCNFNHLSYKCGSYTPLIGVGDGGQTTYKDGEMCVTDPVKIYTGDGRNYTDEGLRPYHEYSYSVVAVNGAGSSSSEYTSAITSQTLPEGVNPPEASVEPDQLYTVFLSWTPPLKSNGPILWYIITRDDVEIYRDPFKLELVDNNAIQPYRTYIYQLTVCNGAGCVNSIEVKVATLEGTPEGVVAPTILVESAYSMVISWLSPSEPNGFITSYSLYLISDEDEEIYKGSEKSYQLTALEPYTEYTFIIGACTGAGCANSSMVSGRTLEDKPIGMALPKLIVQNSTTLEIYWSKPDNVSGVLKLFQVYRSTDAILFHLIFSTLPTTYTYTDESLQSDTEYFYLVEAINGAGGVNSSVSSVKMPTVTPDDIPSPHNVTVLTFSSIFIEWEAVSSVDQYRIVLNAGTPDHFEKVVGLFTRSVVNDLLPYTVYTVRITACTEGEINGCGTGPAVSVRTFEAAPEGQEPPRLAARGSSSVEISWKPPTHPNGEITQYQVYRRELGDDSRGLIINVLEPTVTGFTNAGPDLTPYTEYEYQVISINSIGESVSDWAQVRTLAAPPQVLYAPIVSSIDTYSMVLQWQAPLKTNGLIMVYRLQYKIVNDDPTIVSSTMSVTVSGTSLTTSISGLHPYTPYEVRIVAVNSAGQVASSWTHTTTDEAAPSGIPLFQVEKISTGTSVILRWSIPERQNGIISNYLVFEEGNFNAIYQGLNREFEYRRLEPFTDYKVMLEACTDGGCARSPVQTITTSEVTPQNQPSPSIGNVNATHVVINWKQPLNPNGNIKLFEVLRRIKERLTKRQVGQSKVIYSTNDAEQDTFTFTDSNLEPYTTYEYSIRATNSRGSIESPWEEVETMQAAPEGVSPPVVSLIGSASDRLKIQWSAPTKINGVLQGYRVQRNDTVPWSFEADDELEYIDYGLISYTYYSYRVTACTAGGCSTSQPAIRRTQQTAPLFVLSPTVNVINSTAITVTWQAPQITNGQISIYHLKLDEETVYSGLNNIYTAGSLVPYRAYTFRVAACTLGGCTESESIIGRPHEAPPLGMDPPRLQVLGANSIEVNWDPPRQPNGIITSYELRRDGYLIETTSLLQYVDYEVNPGEEYSYTVTAYNSKGDVQSVSAVAKTYASAPVGMSAPVLKALSSTSVSATWAPPLKPNGEIYNYTLYQGSEVVFSERQLTAVITGLEHWTEYSFRVQACTSQGCAMSDPTLVKTLQAPPLGMAGPKLTAYVGDNSIIGVRITWAPPRRPNGLITHFELFRRNYTAVGGGQTTGPDKLLYSGSHEEFRDTDTSLHPFTYYEYMLIAYNSEGRTSSPWEVIQTDEAAPGEVPAPAVEEVGKTSIRIEIKEPAQPNGIIRQFNIFLNGKLEFPTRSTSVLVGRDVPLEPYTTYTIHVEACTAGGCTASPSIHVRTLAQRPQGLAAPLLLNITTSSMDVVWQAPAEPNGVIIEYVLTMRTACPQPYADADDGVEIPCSEGAESTKARGLLLNAQVTGLQPYTAYLFSLQVHNEAGGLERPVTAVNHTLPAEPVYNKNSPPKVKPSGEMVNIDWLESFSINSEVKEFILYKDGVVEYSGLSTNRDVKRQSKYQTYEFQVVLKTDTGEASTPLLIFDPTVPDYLVVASSTAPPATTEEVISNDKPVYEEVWFIVVVAVVALVVIFVILFLCLRSPGRRMPYIREHSPLHGHQKKAPPFYTDDFDGALNGGQYGSAAANAHPATQTLPHTGYANPAYSHLVVPSQAGSLTDLDLDKISQKSVGSRWDDDHLPGWDAPVRNDSGLHSITYGDDYDAASDRPISVLKQHTMFNDTHL